MDPERTVWCGNVSEKVTEDLLFELFLQVAPVEKVRIPTDKDGRQSSFAFVTFKHRESVDYAIQLLNGISLFDKRLNIRPKNTNQPTQQSQPIQQRNFESSPIPNQNHMNLMNSYNDLLRLGEMMHLGYSQVNSSYENWHSPDINANRHYRERDDRRKEDCKPYRHHDRYSNNSYRSYASPRQGHNNYSDHRSRKHRQY